MYNDEVAQEYEKVVEKNKLRVDLKFIGILAIPYILFFVFDFTTKFRTILLIAYTLMLFNIGMGLGIGCLLFFVLFIFGLENSSDCQYFLIIRIGNDNTRLGIGRMHNLSVSNIQCHMAGIANQISGLCIGKSVNCSTL